MWGRGCSIAEAPTLPCARGAAWKGDETQGDGAHRLVAGHSLMSGTGSGSNVSAPPARGRNQTEARRVVNAAYRWHALAYCEVDRSFKDFLLSRIIETRSVRPNEASPADNSDWNEIITLEIGPHTELSESRKKDHRPRLRHGRRACADSSSKGSSLLRAEAIEARYAACGSASAESADRVAARWRCR
jgi:hypothetical protein